eukprot:17075-Heterococcus_DN1.PRE.2
MQHHSALCHMLNVKLVAFIWSLFEVRRSFLEAQEVVVIRTVTTATATVTTAITNKLTFKNTLSK